MVARSTIKLDESQTLNLRKLSYVGGLTSKGQVGVLPGEHRGVDVAHSIFIYSKILCTTACFPISPQRGINYPPTCIGPPFSPERSNVLHTFLRSDKAVLTFLQADCRNISTLSCILT